MASENVITVIPIYTDSDAAKYADAERLLREVAASSIDLDVWPYFKEQAIYVGDVQFLDMRKNKPLAENTNG